jgi:hypothetical protein
MFIEDEARSARRCGPLPVAELGIGAVEGEQFVVGAGLDDMPVICRMSVPSIRISPRVGS